MQPRGYRAVASSELGVAPKPPAPSRIQWFLLGVLTCTAGIVLVLRFPQHLPAAGAPAAAFAGGGNGTAADGRPRRRGRRHRWSVPMSMGRMGTSSSFVLRSRPRRIKGQAAKAATRSVVLVGSHFALGNELLKRVFDELCRKPRLSLKCEPTWDGKHDLKTLAAGKKKRRLVWLETDAARLRRTLRSVRAHAADFRMVHVLWDPVQACAAQWPNTLSTNVSFGKVCSGLRMEEAAKLYQRGLGHRTRTMQLRLEELSARRADSPKGSPWRQLFKFLGLAEKGGDLSAIGQR